MAGVTLIEMYRPLTGELVIVDPVEARLSEVNLRDAMDRVLKPFLRASPLVTDTTPSW